MLCHDAGTACAGASSYLFRVKRKLETVVESCTISSYTFGEWIIHVSIRLRDYEGVPSRQEVLLLKGYPF